jgi:hypothetical protein
VVGSARVKGTQTRKTVTGHQAGPVQVGPDSLDLTKPKTRLKIAIARLPVVVTNPWILVSPTVQFQRPGLIRRPVTSSIIPMAIPAPPMVPPNQLATKAAPSTSSI